MERSNKDPERIEDGPLDLRRVDRIRLLESDGTNVGSLDSQDSEETTTESENYEGPDSGSPDLLHSKTDTTDFIQNMIDHIDLDLTDEQNQKVQQLLQRKSWSLFDFRVRPWTHGPCPS